jgi:putative endonuclease
MWQHRNDALPGFSRRYHVHRLVRFELFGDMERAIAREKQLKRWHRQWKINLIESENADWHDLAVSLGLPSLPHQLGRDGC